MQQLHVLAAVLGGECNRGHSILFSQQVNPNKQKAKGTAGSADMPRRNKLQSIPSTRATTESKTYVCSKVDIEHACSEQACNVCIDVSALTAARRRLAQNIHALLQNWTRARLIRYNDRKSDQVNQIEAEGEVQSKNETTQIHTTNRHRAHRNTLDW